jgi:hypothetical protein
MRTLSTVYAGIDDYFLPEGARVVSGGEVYVVGPLIGRGGFGVIYSAQMSGIRFALKLAVDNVPISKLLREAEISAALSAANFGVLAIRILPSPQILTEESGEAIAFGDRDFRIGVMRDMSEAGTTLSDIIRSERQSLPDAVRTMKALLRTLIPVHEDAGVQYIHGDISPENIIYVAQQESAVFIDFGNAQKMTDGLYADIAREEITYNPLFMAPEVRRFLDSGEPHVRLRRASDIYSLGMIFYALLFGMPSSATCEHISVICRNRVQERFHAYGRDRALAYMLNAFFERCFAPREEDRFANLNELGAVLDEMLQVHAGASISKAGALERVYTQRMFRPKFSEEEAFNLLLETPDGTPADLARQLRRRADTAPLLLTGPRGSGKRTLVTRACAALLDRAGLIPIRISAEELSSAGDEPEFYRAAALAILRRLYGGHSAFAVSEATIFALQQQLGFFAASAESAEYLLVIEDAELLARRPSVLDAIADATRHVSRTRFMFTGKAAPEAYESAIFRALFTDRTVFHLRGISADYAAQVLAARAERTLTAEQAAMFTSPAILDTLLTRVLPLAEPRPGTPLTFAEILSVLDMHFRTYTEGRFTDLAAFAYRLRAETRAQAAPADLLSADLVREAVQDGILAWSVKGSEATFLSPLIADYFAARHVLAQIQQAKSLQELRGINHLWNKGLTDMLRAFPEREVRQIPSQIEALSPTPELTVLIQNIPDLLPVNLFALTGDIAWASISVQTADALFLSAVLSGYLVSGGQLVLCDELMKFKGYATAYDFSGSELPDSYWSWAERVRSAVQADLEYGFRLPKNEVLTAALAPVAEERRYPGIRRRGANGKDKL